MQVHLLIGTPLNQPRVYTSGDVSATRRASFSLAPGFIYFPKFIPYIWPGFDTLPWVCLEGTLQRHQKPVAAQSSISFRQFSETL